MAGKKAIILIDGQNLYYSIKEMGIVEKDINWTSLFQSLLDPDDDFIRAYWFRPQRLLTNHCTPLNIRRSIVYKRFNTYSEAYNANPATLPEPIAAQVEQQASEVEKWIHQQQLIFNNIEHSYDNISMLHENIEIIKTGIVKLDPYKQIYIGEKGVDISLAVKMIELAVDGSCEKIVLVSGDYDYVEAIKYVKRKMIKMHIAKIHKGVPPKNKSMSRDLATLADKLLNVYESDIKASHLISTTKA